MEKMLQSCGSLSVIYHPLKKNLRFTCIDELLTREMILMLQKVLGGHEQQQVSGSLFMRYRAETLSMDWGHVCIQVGQETIAPLRLFLGTLDLTEPQSAIFFYEVEGPYGCFSNCSPHGVELDGQWWRTTEHFFQAQKFASPVLQEMIRCTASPKDVAKRGRDRSLPWRPDWEEVKEEVMRRAVLRKFETHASLRQILLDTGDTPLIEDAPHDYYWGCGEDGSGKNRLGQILMEARMLLSR